MAGSLRRAVLIAAAGMALLAPPAAAARGAGERGLGGIRHFVVIYEENHSFDNLYGRWERVDGLRDADFAHAPQVSQAGRPYECLLQNDVNLASPPRPARCTNPAPAFESRLPNEPFAIDHFIAPGDTTCPPPGASASNGVPKGAGLPGGCTRDLVHRYYQEQYQLDGGKQDRYVTGSDAVGLTMGTYRTRRLPIYRYLHEAGPPHYVIADDFFQAAFGGSFLNHRWLIAAATPTWPGAVNDGSADDLHSVVDENGMPTNYPLYKSPLGDAAKDQALTASCSPAEGRPATPAGVTCGDFAVNTIQPFFQPFRPNTADNGRLPPQTAPTIGDRLSAGHVSWAWYSGGWSNANGDVGGPGWTNGTEPAPATADNAKPCPDPAALANATWPNCPDRLFQFHHQPLNYFASFAPGTTARARHLRDEKEFLDQAAASKQRCRLDEVSFVKPVGAENDHPGYASEPNGSDHLVRLIQAVRGGARRRGTVIVVTYDEFGGQWDHVPPPGQGGTPGPHDEMGPGTRIPALVLSPELPRRF